jgi:hypothetical protein
MLRGEEGVYYEDLYALVSILPQYDVPETDSVHALLPARLPPPFNNAPTDSGSRTDDVELGMGVSRARPPSGPLRKAGLAGSLRNLILRLSQMFSTATLDTRRSYAFTNLRRRRPKFVESIVPLQITLFFSSYLAWLQKESLVTEVVAGGVMESIGLLQDAMSNLDRLRKTPIPFIYSAHLRLTVWYVKFLTRHNILTTSSALHQAVLTVPSSKSVLSFDFGDSPLNLSKSSN